MGIRNVLRKIRKEMKSIEEDFEEEKRILAEKDVEAEEAATPKI